MQNQRGFVGVEVLIAILVGIAILGGAYFVMQQKSSYQTATDIGQVATDITTSVTDNKNEKTSPESKPSTILNQKGSVNVSVTFNPKPAVGNDLEKVHPVSIQRGGIAALSWEVPSASHCQIDVLKTISFDVWGRDLAMSGSITSDPILYDKEKYRLLCVLKDNMGLLSDVVEFQLPPTNQPPISSATITAAPGGTQTSTTDLVAAATDRDFIRVSHIKNIQLALELFYTDNKAYPTTLSSLALASQYLSVVPKDPLDNSLYLYDQIQDGESYELGANLETNSSALLSDGSDLVVAGGNLTSGTDSKSCTGVFGRHCYNVSQ